MPLVQIPGRDRAVGGTHRELRARVKEKKARQRIAASMKSQSASPALPVSRATGTSAMISCQFYHYPLRAKNLDRHLKRAHAAELKHAHAAKLTPTNAPVTRSQPRSDQSHDTAMALTGRDTQDASKYIGHFAREHGRSGSMPSYDDFSDEGGPD